jgi:hypothetical protein
MNYLPNPAQTVAADETLTPETRTRMLKLFQILSDPQNSSEYSLKDRLNYVNRVLNSPEGGDIIWYFPMLTPWFERKGYLVETEQLGVYDVAKNILP